MTRSEQFEAMVLGSPAVRGDGSQVYTSSGQVWSGDLRRLARFDAAGTEIEYVPSRERLYISDGSRVTEVDATNSSIVRERLLPAPGGTPGERLRRCRVPLPGPRHDRHRLPS